MEIFKLILANLQNLTAFLATVLSILFFWLTHVNSKKSRIREKELEIKYNDKEDLRKQKKLVYASLSRVLFDVQQLHVSLSGKCIDQNCITKALQKFDTSIGKSHEDISNNMLYLSSEIIDFIYQFYKEIGNLKIELSELNADKKYEEAHACVELSSISLATIIIEIQRVFINEHPDMKINFDKTQQQSMINCCGANRRSDAMEKYLKSRNK